MQIPGQIWMQFNIALSKNEKIGIENISMSKSNKALTPLAFGHTKSHIALDLEEMQSRVNSITNWVSDYDTLDKNAAFHHRSSVYAGDGVRLIAVSSSPTVMKVNDPDYTIAVPIQGSIESWVNKKNLIPEIGKHGVFTSKGSRHTEGEAKSCILISVTEQQLEKTGRVMLGEHYMSLMQLDKPRLVETQIQKVDFSLVLGQVCNLIDQFNGDQALLRSFNVDENITRLVVMMLAPDQFIKASEIDKSGVGKKVIDHLCDFIVANLGSQISLTTLETLSGLSSRTLQKEFQKYFSCTPMQWIKQQRLARAKELLLDAVARDTIASVAACCGYSNFSEFSRHYKELFGVLPNETLKKSRNR